MIEIYKLSGFQQELDKAERFFSMHLTRQELKSRLDKIERLENIIKEVREYIEKTKFKYCDDELCYMIENHYNRILEILEKENKE